MVIFLKLSYERIEIDECVVNSSRERLKRAKEMKMPEKIDDLLDMAYDTTNETYPIYRGPHMNFSVHCLATGINNLTYFNLILLIEKKIYILKLYLISNLKQ
jgi:hypothetical protein